MQVYVTLEMWANVQRDGRRAKYRCCLLFNAATLFNDFSQLPESQLRSYPLVQLVTSPTHGSNILGKIFTDVKRWYQSPLVLPPVGSSDHHGVLLQPLASSTRPNRRKQTTYRRSSDPTGKAMIYYHLRQFNWSPLFVMNSCQDMTNYFYFTLQTLLDQYLPSVPYRTYSADKPWITSQFRELVKRRQRAFLSGQTDLYHKLRNQTKHLATSLRQKYFEKHIKSLHTLDPHSWWSKVKHFFHPSDSNPLRCLQDSDSDLALAESINDFFVSISAALRPLDSNTFLSLDSDYTPNFIIDPVDVDARLARIKIHKAPGPDGIPNWLLLGATLFTLTSEPPPSSPHFYTRCPSCHNPPNLSWLGTGTGICWIAYPVAWFKKTSDKTFK